MQIFAYEEELNLEQYRAVYLNTVYQMSGQTSRQFMADNALLPLYFGSKTKHDSLTLKFKFLDATIEEISAFSQKLVKCTVVFDAGVLNGKTAECVLVKSNLQKISRRVRTVDYEFQAYVFGETQEIRLSGGIQTLWIPGAKESEAVLTVTNTQGSTVSVSVMGIAINELYAGETITIDGEKKTVMNDMGSVFGRVKLTSFPRLKPGDNEITVTGPAEVTLRFRERW